MDDFNIELENEAEKLIDGVNEILLNDYFDQCNNQEEYLKLINPIIDRMIEIFEYQKR